MSGLRGSVTDRPWGETLGALGLRDFRGQLTLTSGAERYEIAFGDGAVVAATSPHVADSPTRVAMLAGLLSPTQASQLHLQRDPDRDELEVIAELAELAPDRLLQLRRARILQCASRTFGVERGEYVIDDRITLVAEPGCALDVRLVVFQGARQFLPESRLYETLAELGGRFTLAPDAVLPAFDVAREAQLLALLRRGATLEELEVMAGVEPRVAAALVYALVTCNDCAAAPGPRSVRRAQPPPPGQRRRSAVNPAGVVLVLALFALLVRVMC